MHKVCVSLAANDAYELEKMIGEAIEGNADLIEIRFDYIDKDLEGALSIASKYSKRCIFTCRSRSEGGRYNGSENERLEVLKMLAKREPYLLDVEYNIVNRIDLSNANLLISWHNFEYTPEINEMISLMNDMSKFGRTLKIVTTANSIDDNMTVLQLYKHASKMNVTLISFCMGEKGMPSRLLSTYAGAPFTYAALKTAIAPGQLTMNEMRRLHQMKIDRIDMDAVNKIMYRIKELRSQERFDL